MEFGFSFLNLLFDVNVKTALYKMELFGHQTKCYIWDAFYSGFANLLETDLDKSSNSPQCHKLKVKSKGSSLCLDKIMGLYCPLVPICWTLVLMEWTSPNVVTGRGRTCQSYCIALLVQILQFKKQNNVHNLRTNEMWQCKEEKNHPYSLPGAARADGIV